MGAVKGLRITTVVFGLIVVGVGMYSHFQSSWVKPQSVEINTDVLNKAEFPTPSSTCKKQQEHLSLDSKTKPCPDIIMEQCYVGIIIICWIISVVLLFGTCCLQMEKNPVRKIDLVYHIIAAVLLLIAGILYVVSAKLINDIYGDLEKENRKGDEILDSVNVVNPVKVAFLFIEKIVAAVLTIVLALIYGGLAWKIPPENPEE